MIYDSEKEKYQAYLCSREWGLLRAAVQDRCDGICERCNHFRMSHVHHLTYIRKYDERLEDLQGLCEGCHSFTHGRRKEDPLLAVPVRFRNREIKSVYLAGRISNGHGAWRNEIAPHWANDMGSDDNWYRRRDRPAMLPDGRSIKYAGPFWKQFAHDNSYGPHAMGEFPEDNHGMRVHSELEDPHGLIINIYHAITGCDLVFAWLDSREAWGTIWELGFAWQRCPIVVAAPKFDRELWLACRAANEFFVAGSAGEAWKMLWSGKPRTDIYVLDKNENYGTWEKSEGPDPDIPVPGGANLPAIDIARVHQIWDRLAENFDLCFDVRLSMTTPIRIEDSDVLVIGPRADSNGLADSCEGHEIRKKIGACLQILLRQPVTVLYERESK